MLESFRAVIEGEHPILKGSVKYEPFRVDHSGKSYYVATDGNCALVFEDPECKLKINSTMSPAIESMIEKPGNVIGRINVGNICDACEDSTVVNPCEECCGKGVLHRRDLKASVVSVGSNDDKEEICFSCRGSGRDNRSMTSICFNFVELNTELLKRVFAGADRSERVSVHLMGQYDPVQFIGSGWRAIVAPVVPGTVVDSDRIELDPLI